MRWFPPLLFFNIFCRKAFLNKSHDHIIIRTHERCKELGGFGRDPLLFCWSGGYLDNIISTRKNRADIRKRFEDTCPVLPDNT